ncbi:PEP-utilizing enzyme [Actinosynnema sp. NPDC002837]
MTRVRLGTKAESLVRLAPLVTRADVPPLACFPLRRRQAERERVLDDVLRRPWARGPLMARSSAGTEDSAHGSQAGRFRTLPGLHTRAQLADGVDRVFASYDGERPDDQVLVQPQVRDGVLSGVACGRDPSGGAPYLVVDWVEGAGADAVTAGRVGGVNTWYGTDRGPDAPLPGVTALLREPADLTGVDGLEVEFAVRSSGALVLLQVRPLVVAAAPVPAAAHRRVLERVSAVIGSRSSARGPVVGKRTVFGVMPDWNPAEIIGLRPRPLASSLYRRLITDDVYARARRRYGYRDLSGVPLLVDFAGLPYVDVRVSLNSLLPQGLPDDLAAHLVDHWLERLVDRPHLHDKVESEVVVSNLGLRPDRVDAVAEAGLTTREHRAFREALRELTDRMVSGPLWERNLASLRLLDPRPGCGHHEPGCCAPGIAAMLDTCVAHGTPPFAGLARAAFVATELLGDLVATGVFSEDERAAFVAGLGLVAGELKSDFASMGKTAFLKRYGHLRPGAYDILSPRYDEEPDRYFDWSAPRPPVAGAGGFRPGPGQVRAIDRLIRQAGFTFDAHRLPALVGAAIRGRERPKFEFTAVPSDVLVGVREFGSRHGFSADEMSYVDVEEIGSNSLEHAVERGRAAHAVSRGVVLPPLITGPDDVWGFLVPATRPNFVTRGRVVARVADVDAGDEPKGAIALVAGADPGYDWLFSRGVAGLVTAFGGVNSHMAIRALELGVPAVIGVGESQFRAWLGAAALEVDAGAGHVGVVT